MGLVGQAGVHHSVGVVLVRVDVGTLALGDARPLLQRAHGGAPAEEVVAHLVPRAKTREPRCDNGAVAFPLLFKERLRTEGEGARTMRRSMRTCELDMIVRSSTTSPDNGDIIM